MALRPDSPSGGQTNNQYVASHDADWKSHETYVCQVTHETGTFEKVLNRSECSQLHWRMDNPGPGTSQPLAQFFTTCPTFCASLCHLCGPFLLPLPETHPSPLLCPLILGIIQINPELVLALHPHLPVLPPWSNRIMTLQQNMVPVH